MEISMNPKCESPVKDTVKTAALGAVVAGGVQLGHNLKPVVKDSFTSSIKRQQGVLDKFKASGKSVEEYLAPRFKFVQGLNEPGSVVKTLTKEGQTQEAIKNFTEKYKDVVSKGTEQYTKDLEKTQKFLAKGKVSKFEALKDTACEFGSKVKAKFSAFKGAENKLEFIKNQPKLKQVGKAALIGAAIIGGAKLITEIAKANKTEE